MEDSRGFYQVLGLKAGASMDEVKKAYKKKQFELHPSGQMRRKMRDSAEYKALTEEQKNAKEAKMDEEVAKINEAYKCLSDEKKKNEYDTGTGEYGFSAGGGEGFGGFADIFSQFYSGRGQSQGKPKAKNVTSDIKVDYKDLFLGKMFKFRVKSQKVCKPCQGRGAKETQTCTKCKGAGKVMARVSFGIMVSTSMVECPDCEGIGYQVKGSACSDCKGQRIVTESQIVEVKLEPGHSLDDPIVFKGQGNEFPGYIAGDLVFKVVLNQIPGWQRIGNDFICRADVDILTAVSGGLIYFDHPDGRKISIKVNPFKNFESSIVVAGEGFPSRGRRGNLYINPNILINTGIDRNKLSEILKPLVKKPAGEFTSVNSSFGKPPQVYEDENASEGYERQRSDFSDFFKFY